MSNGITVEIVEQVYDLQLITDKITTVEIFDFAVSGDVIPASIFTDGPGNLIVSAGASDPRQLNNVTSPPTNGYVLTWDDTESLKMKFKASGTAGEITLTNKSGGTVNAGDVVIFDKTNASAFTTTSTQGDMRILGVAKETIANNSSGKIAMAGIATINVTGNVAIGAALISSTTPKYAKASGGAKQNGLIGFALTAYVGGATGTVDALLMPAFERAGAGVVVEGVASVSGAAGTTTLQCGTNSDRLVLAVFMYGRSIDPGAVTAVPKVAAANMTITGSPITGYHNDTFTYSYADVYYLKDPGTGSQTVTGGNTGFSDYFVTFFIALSGVATSSYIGTMNSAQITGTAQSVNCSDAIPGDTAVYFMLNAGNPGAATGTISAHGSGQTNQLAAAVGSYVLGSIDTKPATAANETTAITLSGSRKSLNISIPVRPA